VYLWRCVLCLNQAVRLLNGCRATRLCNTWNTVFSKLYTFNVTWNSQLHIQCHLKHSITHSMSPETVNYTFNVTWNSHLHIQCHLKQSITYSMSPETLNNTFKPIPFILYLYKMTTHVCLCYIWQPMYVCVTYDNPCMFVLHMTTHVCLCYIQLRNICWWFQSCKPSIILILSLRKKMQPSHSNIEFAGGVANWCRLGYELSVVNITTDVVWILSNWLIADDIQHC